MFLSTTTALGSIRATRWDCRLRSTGSGRRRRRQPDPMPPQFSCVPLRSTSENCAVLPCFSDFGYFPTAHFLTFPFLCRGFCRFPFHSQHHMKKRFCQLKGAFGENGCEKVLCFPLLPSTDRAAVFPNTFFFFITTTVGKPGLGKMDAKKVAGFQKISAAHGSSLFSFCFHSKGGATAF